MFSQSPRSMSTTITSIKTSVFVMDSRLRKESVRSKKRVETDLVTNQFTEQTISLDLEVATVQVRESEHDISNTTPKLLMQVIMVPSAFVVFCKNSSET